MLPGCTLYLKFFGLNYCQLTDPMVMLVQTNNKLNSVWLNSVLCIGIIIIEQSAFKLNE